MSVIEKLKEAVRSVVDAERQDLYAEARLQDGRVVATEAEQFSAGVDVRVMSEDGEATPLQAGTYELADGGELKVDDDSKVAMMEEEEKKDEELAEHEEEEKDEMSAVKAALVDHFQISEEVAEQIVDVVKDAMKPAKAEEEMEEEKKEQEMEEEKKDKEEMSALTDLTHEMAVALEAINKRLAKLEEEPAAQPDRVLPKQEFTKEFNPNRKGVDRAFDIISNFS